MQPGQKLPLQILSRDWRSITISHCELLSCPVHPPKAKDGAAVDLWQLCSSLSRASVNVLTEFFPRKQCHLTSLWYRLYSPYRLGLRPAVGFLLLLLLLGLMRSVRHLKNMANQRNHSPPPSGIDPSRAELLQGLRRDATQLPWTSSSAELHLALLRRQYPPIETCYSKVSGGQGRPLPPSRFWCSP